MFTKEQLLTAERLQIPFMALVADDQIGVAQTNAETIRNMQSGCECIVAKDAVDLVVQTMIGKNGSPVDAVYMDNNFGLDTTSWQFTTDTAAFVSEQFGVSEDVLQQLFESDNPMLMGNGISFACLLREVGYRNLLYICSNLAYGIKRGDIENFRQRCDLSSHQFPVDGVISKSEDDFMEFSDGVDGNEWKLVATIAPQEQVFAHMLAMAW